MGAVPVDFYDFLSCNSHSRLATSLTMDQFGWTKKEALYYMGIVMSVGGVIACFTFASIAPLCRL